MEWISVDDRLPEDIGPYLVVWQNQTQHITFVYCCEVWHTYDPHADDIIGEVVDDDFISHWMPLPSPPEAT
jgi:hypothetical protein